MLSVIFMHVQNANAETNCWIQKCNENSLCKTASNFITLPGGKTFGKWMERKFLHHDC